MDIGPALIPLGDAAWRAPNWNKMETPLVLGAGAALTFQAGIFPPRDKVAYPTPSAGHFLDLPFSSPSNAGLIFRLGSPEH